MANAESEPGRRVITRRRFLAALAVGAATTGSAAAYARRFEPNWFELTRTSVRGIPLRPTDAARPFRILHLSDLHASAVVSLASIEEAVGLGLTAEPDLIALTGDFVTGQDISWSDYSAVLSQLTAAAPTFACLGNHDGGAWTQRRGRPYTSRRVEALLADAGIELLHNRTVTRTIAENPVRITGVGDLWAGECEPAIAFWNLTPAPPGIPHLVLNHNPDAKDLFNAYPWDLMLCGHTHGGQLRLPILGAPFAPIRDKRFVEGLHPWGGRQLYVTRGVGNLHGVRFNCRPEVSVLELLAAG